MNRFIELVSFYYLVSNQKFNKTTTKILKAHTYTDAVIEGIEFRSNFLGELLDTNQLDVFDRSGLVYLFDAQIAYADHYADIDVPAHKKKNRSKTQISNMMRALTLFNQALEEKNINKKILRCDKVNEIHVGYFHNYLNHYASNTYNRFVNSCKSFFKWAIKTYDLRMENPAATI
ncbi:hypothetical protein [Aquimarina sp. RZ0]|uniref:hypothetical protein n=1 Tax=Aquimarina sp. RZ0 TaxID=2607730 RepID=UPI0011F2A4A5|nr:hypothetical protein [Aquimarina sp. RZ0]KAA1242657.1 hypothetical protein F0000_24705 [Aquimarina sp. RZ0]